MSDLPEGAPNVQFESEVWSAISAFEQILESAPQDRAALETLTDAYERIGDHTRALDYMLRLGEVLIEDSDIPNAVRLARRIRVGGIVSSDAAEFLDKTDALADEHGISVEDPVVEPSTASAASEPEVLDAVERLTQGFSMADELFFAWNLMEGDELTQEEYASVVHDLTEMSTSSEPMTVSVLHVLEARAFKHLERTMAHVSRECGTPIVSLASFDFQHKTVAVLPYELMVRRGVLVFETLAEDLLIVIMNPYNRTFRKEIEDVLGKSCHFYMALPSDFDGALLRVGEVIEEHAKYASEAG